MTICIGAICEKKYVVLATDRMITLLQPNIEYEQVGITKAIEITPTCFAETAGSAIAFVEILKEALIDIQKESIKDISKIAEIIRNNYVKCRNKKLDEQILFPIGLNLQTFWQNNQSLNPQIATACMMRMQQYNYQLWILLAGVDDHGGHIWHIENPGQMYCFDSIGFHAVGSGQDHARSTFIANEFDPTIDLSHGLAITFEAKKRSEKATGVGELTDIVIISKEGHKRLNDEEKNMLNEIYKKRLDTERTGIMKLEEMIEALDFIPKSQ